MVNLNAKCCKLYNVHCWFLFNGHKVQPCAVAKKECLFSSFLCRICEKEFVDFNALDERWYVYVGYVRLLQKFSSFSLGVLNAILHFLYVLYSTTKPLSHVNISTRATPRVSQVTTIFQVCQDTHMVNDECNDSYVNNH